MKKIRAFRIVIVLILFLFVSCNEKKQKDNFNENRQKVKLFCPVIEPRLGRSTSLTLDLAFLNKAFIKNISKGVDLQFMEQNYSVSVQFKDTGIVIVKPINFEFNGVKYTTDYLKIRVAGPLNYNKDTVCVRYVKTDSLSYLILEQIKKVIKDKNGIEISKLNFIKVKGDTISNYDTHGYFKSNNLYFKSFYGGGGGISNHSGDNYRSMFKIYKVQNRSNMDILLTRNYFENIPLNINISEILVKK